MNIAEFDKEFRRKIIAQGGDYATAKTYGNCMGVFMKYFKDKHDSPLRIPTVDMENYIIHLRENGYSASYINQFIASAKRFYKLNGHPQKCDKLVYHDRPQTTPNVLTYQECMAMCESKIYIKQRCVINLLYYGALRKSELLNLKIQDLSKDRRILISQSKYRKSRVITIPEKTLILLREYFCQCNPKVYLFNGDMGREQYSEKSVENIIKNTARLCGISKRVYPHIMRASRATHLLDNGASEMYMTDFLGHSKIQTMKDYYCKLTIKGMQDNFDRIDEKMTTSYQNEFSTQPQHDKSEY